LGLVSLFGILKDKKGSSEIKKYVLSVNEILKLDVLNLRS